MIPLQYHQFAREMCEQRIRAATFPLSDWQAMRRIDQQTPRGTWLAQILMLRSFNRSILLWLLAFAVVGFTYFGVHAVLFSLYLLRLGFEPRFIGVLIGSGQVVFALMALPAGEVGRRTGVRGAFIAGLVVLGLAYAGLLGVEALPHSAWAAWLFVWWAAMWFGAALANVNSVTYGMALAGDAAPRAFAAQSAVIGIMSFVGSLAGTAILGVIVAWTGTSTADPGAYHAVLWMTPVAFIACAVAMLAAKPAPSIVPRVTKSGNGATPLGLFVLLGAVVFLFTVGDGALRAFFNVYLDTRLLVPTAQIGLTMGLAQLVPIVAALAVPGLVVRFGSAGTLTIASLIAAAGLLGIGVLPLLPVAGLAYMVAISMTAVHGATRNLFSQQLVEAPWRTTTAAILTVGLGLGWATSAVAGGLLVGILDFHGLFLITASLVAGAAMLTWTYQRGAWVRSMIVSSRWSRPNQALGDNYVLTYTVKMADNDRIV
jgi:MFS family permease